MKRSTLALAPALVALLAACSTVPDGPAGASASAPPALAIPANATADPTNWPQARSPSALTDPATEARIDALLARMTLEQKVGQLIQADIASITPADLRRYPLGSILAGGNSGPGGNERAPAAEWDRLVRAFRAVSLEPAANGVAIPILFGVDAVHGHNNLPGATIFPHNIGLGAARDPALVRRIGAATAAEIAGSGIEWTFAPTLAVPQDPRWGRTYEGYSSDPALVAAYGREMVLGLQGELRTGEAVGAARVAATAKHFLADGGTRRGQDQGDAVISEAELVAIHNAGYPPAIEAGALTVMASFSSWNGVKHHGNPTLLTNALKERMGFAGFVVGDWNGHGQVPGCTPTDCPQSILAGLDMFMAPDSWRGLYDTTLRQARDGTIPLARIDDAVRRILRVKYKTGLMDGAERRDFAAIGAPAHLALAREAVARSLVLLKNEGGVLPVRPGARVLVAGPGADSMAMQSGGWTVSWQGTDVTRADFPNGQTVWDGIRDAVSAAGGTARLAVDGSASGPADVAIVVYGEQPYAEFEGDRTSLDYQPDGASDLALIERLKARGIPVVSVFLSGRPMFVNPELAASDAFVAAWLPGSQGAGVADVLVARRAGAPARPFTGALPFAWPDDCVPDATPLLPRWWSAGYGAPPALPPLAPTCATGGDTGAGLVLLGRGRAPGVSAGVVVDGRAVPLANLVGVAPGAFSAAAFDVAAQEDARRLTFTRPAGVRLAWGAGALPPGAVLQLRYRVPDAPRGAVRLEGASGALDLRPTFALAAGKGWREALIPLACADGPAGDAVTLSAEAGFVLELQAIRLAPAGGAPDCTGPF